MNPINLFGFQITKKEDKKQDDSPNLKTFSPPTQDDGAVNVQTGSYYGVYVDLDGVVRNEIELVTRYREMGLQPELETAIDEIVNESIVADDAGNSIEINLDDVDQTDSVKKKIREEFEYILKLLDFGNMGHDIFRRWYIDGRMFYHIVIDDKSPAKGIQQLRYIDPRRIRKIREIQKTKDPKSGMEIIKNQVEYYLYNERGVIGAHSNLGTKIAVDSIVNVNSGLMDAKRAMVLSYLHKAIKPLNQLRMVEDAVVIYRLSRAPERRVFYIDVGNMPTIKAEQYVRDIMVKYRNKLVYDSCLAMDTKIPLLDGRTLTITELQKEFEEGKENWVYSCDPVTGKFAPGLITSAGVTRFNEKVMKLTLDNGKTITCTYDHKFPVWNKGKVEAKDLVVGDSMIPFYTRNKKVSSKSNEYHQIFANERNKWVFTHREVSAWKDSNDLLNEMVFNPLYENEDKKPVHHKNYNRFDNSPGNLVRMYNLDHLEYHKQHNSLAGKIGGKRTAEKRKELGIPYFSKRPSKETLIESGKRLSSLKLGFMEWTPEERREHNIQCNKNVVERLATDPEFNAAFRKAISDGWSQESREEAAIRGKENYSEKKGIGRKELCNVCGIKTTIGNIGRWHNEKCKELRNHKITSIEYLEERIDVGTLGIDKNEIYHDYHTFALDVGIYTCNSTGEIKDDRKHLSMLEDFWMPRREGCFSLSTKIKLLDGRDVELGQLIVEHKLGKTNWVYSVSPEGEVVPGKISWAGVTRNDAQVIDIHLDNGEVITATPDHKFILRNGEKIEAQNLQVGSSLMPFYTRDKEVTHNRNGKYPQIQDNKTGKWKFAHRMVSEYIYGERKLNEVVHHVDFTRINNNPENLVYMDKVEHFKFHSEMGTNAWQNGDVETHKKNLSIAGKKFFQTEEGMKRRQEIYEFNKSCESVWKGLETGRNVIKQLRAIDKEVLTKEEYLKKWSKGLTLEASKKGAEIWKETIARDRLTLSQEEFDGKYVIPRRNALKKLYMKKVSSIDLTVLEEIIRKCVTKDKNVSNKEIVSKVKESYSNFNLKKLRIFLSYNGYESITDFIDRRIGEEYLSLKRKASTNRKSNHSVAKIVWRTDKMDVGTLTIDENHEHHDYHNFALSSGIFVMNSRGTEITTLPSGQSLGVMEDVEYFQKKLYKSLGVPISRLEPQQGFSLGRSTEITRDEIKFMKFIMRLRNKFSTLFDDLLRVQLVLKRICTNEEWHEFREKVWYDFKKDNNFNELKEAELLTNRLANLQVIDPFVGRYYSLAWVRKNVLNLTDEDIEEIDKEIQEENAANAEAMQAQGLDPATGQPILQPEPQPGDMPAAPEDQMNPEMEQEEPLPPKFKAKSSEMDFTR